MTYGMENISTKGRNLMNSDELLKFAADKIIVIERGLKPFICNKYDYSRHSESSKLEDMTIEEQKERFVDNLGAELIQKKEEIIKKKYTFKDF